MNVPLTITKSQCDTVTSVTVEVEDKGGSDTSSLSSRQGSIISNMSGRR